MTPHTTRDSPLKLQHVKVFAQQNSLFGLWWCLKVRSCWRKLLKSEVFKVNTSCPVLLPCSFTELYALSGFMWGEGGDDCGWIKHVWWRFLQRSVTSVRLCTSTLWRGCCHRERAGPGHHLPDQHTHVSLVFTTDYWHIQYTHCEYSAVVEEPSVYKCFLLR